ncbi:MAG: AarF/ABC1/UbiB kinase family protein [Leptospiraceae bacterium]|nr:AarF/ABC1/UbiB kinase family protein [Leptospiraceae bacterium]
MFKILVETRRAIYVVRGIIDLVLEIWIAKLYRHKGLRPRPWHKRLLAGIIRRILRRDKITGTFPVQFRKTLERLGPTYIKLGQILSLREDMLPEDVTRELRQLQSGVPPISYEAARGVIESEFQKPIRLIFKEFSEKPIAAASLAQAHMATLVNGQKVVVKVQRPGIIKGMMDDISLMKRLAAIMEKIPGIRDYKPAQLVDEFAVYTMRELDFRQEGKHADIFRENFKEEPNIQVPEIYWDYTTRRLLCMEFVSGLSPDDSKKIKKAGYNGKALAEVGSRFVIKMLFIDGFFHGDPHPGNLLITGKTRFCLLDLGMIGEFSEDTRKNLFLYYYYLITREFDTASEYLLAITKPGPNSDPEGFKAAVAEINRNWYGAGFKNYSLGKLILNALNKGAKFKVYYNSDIMLAIKAIITIEAVGHILDPEMNLADVSKPLMADIFLQQFSVMRLVRSQVIALPDYMTFLEQFPQRLLKTLNMVSSGKIKLERVQRALPAEQTEKARFPVFSAAIFTGGIVLSLSTITPGPLWFGIPALGLGTILISIPGLLKSVLSSNRLKS